MTGSHSDSSDAGGSSDAGARLDNFGVLHGTPVPAVVLSNRAGLRARIVAYGATLQELWVPDRHGRREDVVLGYPSLDGMLANPQFFGVIVGRCANRIAGGRFAINGVTHQAPINNGPNSLHGGPQGFDKQLWTIAELGADGAASVSLTLTSPDGDAGYPGTAQVKVTYSLDDNNTLRIAYQAVADQDTILNLTNHSYFNLGPGGAAAAREVFDAIVTIAASAYTPTDASQIPTGELRGVAGTAFDFRRPAAVGSRIRDGREAQLVMALGYDQNFVLDKGSTATPEFAARVEDPASGRVLELLTTEPGLQFYTGNMLTGNAVGKGGTIYRQGSALCLEPQKFPDAPNHPHFPSALLRAGQVYRQISQYRFSVA